MVEIIVPNSGERGMFGGAYVTAFVLTKNENFVVKGYHREVENYLKSRRQGVYFAKLLFHNEGKIRYVSWMTNLNEVSIYDRTLRGKRISGKIIKRYDKAVISAYGIRKELKRLPNTFDKFMNIIDDMKQSERYAMMLAEKRNSKYFFKDSREIYEEGFVDGFLSR